MITFRMLCAAATLVLGACDGNAVASIDYNVSESPMSGKRSWSCLPRPPIDGAGASAIDWTVGTPLVVFAVANFKDACGDFSKACPDPQLAFSALAPTTWTVAEGSEPGLSLGPNARYLEAVGTGTGGLKVSAQGDSFPPLQLRAVAPTAFQFLRVDGDPVRANLTPITRLSLAAGTSALVVPRLADGNGKWLCGFPQQTVSASGVTVTSDMVENREGRANAPMQVTAAMASGNLHFVAAGATGDLPVDVTP
jgi:hypothetical protein